MLSHPLPSHSGRAILGLAALTLCIAGCRSFGGQKGFLSRFIDGDEPQTSKEHYDVGKAGLEKVAEAKKKLESHEHKDAIRLAKPVATKSKYKHSYAQPEALYVLGEAHYQLRNYPAADEYFQKLLNDHTNPPHSELVTQRLFSIARTWLLRDPAKNPNDDYNGKKPSNKEFARYNRVIPNLFDRSRPAFDTQGRALNILRTIWLKDPTGSLADDSIMLTGNYHLARGSVREADHFFGVLRNEYPDSPHIKKAFEFGSYVKLASYQGAEYDGSILADANHLRKSTQQLFPGSPEAVRLAAKEKQLREEAAARRWARVEFYQQKGKPRGIAMNCQMLIREYPDTEYAKRAARVLAGIDPKVKRELGLINLTSAQAPAPSSTPEPRRRSFLDRFRPAPREPNRLPDSDKPATPLPGADPETVGTATLP